MQTYSKAIPANYEDDDETMKIQLTEMKIYCRLKLYDLKQHSTSGWQCLLTGELGVVSTPGKTQSLTWKIQLTAILN